MAKFLKYSPPILLILIILCANFSDAAAPLERKGVTSVGEIIFVTGSVTVRLTPEENYRQAAPRQELVVGDIIKTGTNGRASVLLKEDTQLKVASNTTLVVKEIASSKEKPGAFKALLKLESGEVWTRSKGASDGLMIETPYATAAIRGTEWSISVRENESRVIVTEGNVQLSNRFGTVMVGRNEQGVVVGEQAPVKSIIINPGDRIQWTYYLTEKKLFKYLKFKDGGKAENLFNNGMLEESAKAFTDTLSKEPDNYAALTGIGLIELKKGDIEKAKEYLDDALKIKKGLLSLLGKSSILISENMADEAAVILRGAKDFFPSDPLPYIFSAFLYTFNGVYSEALNECDRGIAATQDNSEILAFKTDLYFMLNKPEEAKATIDILLKNNPESSEGREKLGFYHRVVTGDTKKAKESINTAISLDPHNDEAIAKLAEILREEGFIPEALKLIQDALLIAPWNAMHHYNYGRLLADINKTDAARTEFRKSQELDTTFSRAYLGEGIALLQEGKTDEAIKELSKANMFEPNLSETHSLLAIAYYQKQNISAAFDELKRAEECDPLDSTPHQLASTIYNDLYMPVKAIEESRRVLELLPYRKASGEAILENSKNGAMAINYGLDFLDLPEWSLYYAQKALFINPYSNTAHLGVSLAYDKIGDISALQGFNEYANPFFSELLQGYILNVNSLNFSNRYRTLISKPGHYLTLGSTYSTGDSEEREADITASGDFGSKIPLTYWLSASASDDSGYFKDNKTRSTDAMLLLGYKPSYEHDIYLEYDYYDDKIDVPRDVSYWFWLPDDDSQRYRDKSHSLQLGYHRRFSPTSHLLTSFRYVHDRSNLENPGYKTDFTGFSFDRTDIENTAFGIKHMLTLPENHQFSYGFDYNRVKLTSTSKWPLLYPIWIDNIESIYNTESYTFHIYDRWAVSTKIIFDAGLFFSYYHPEDGYHSDDTIFGPYDSSIEKGKQAINPRLGVAIDLGEKATFRLGYQKRTITGFFGELAPVGVSGLVPPTFDIFFSNSHDVQASIDYELTKTTFFRALAGYEKLTDELTSGGDKRAQLWYGRIAINQILGDHFSFSARYHYNDSRYLDSSGRELYGIPKHSGDARLAFVHPSEIYISLRESYTGKRFADSANTMELEEYFLTDFYIQKEFFNKRVVLSCAINNIFNEEYETLDHSYWWYDGALPGRGTTFSFRIEYRI